MEKIGQFTKIELGQLFLKAQVVVEEYQKAESYGEFEKIVMGEPYNLTYKESYYVWDILVLIDKDDYNGELK